MQLLLSYSNSFFVLHNSASTLMYCFFLLQWGDKAKWRILQCYAAICFREYRKDEKKKEERFGFAIYIKNIFYKNIHEYKFARKGDLEQGRSLFDLDGMKQGDNERLVWTVRNADQWLGFYGNIRTTVWHIALIDYMRPVA